jgi:hypothetical protein
MISQVTVPFQTAMLQEFGKQLQDSLLCCVTRASLWKKNAIFHSLTRLKKGKKDKN